MSEEKKGPPVIREVLRVVRKERITPNYLRIVLGGDEVAKFGMVTVGINNKIFIPPKGIDEIHFPEFKPTEFAGAAEAVRPTIRTYTCRALDLERNEMTIDFALHGEEGIASAWALNCRPGDRLGVAMKGLPLELYPAADWYLLAGDATALPVLSVILETLPETARGVAFIEVPTEADEQLIETGAGIEILWIHNPAPGKTTGLQEAVRAADLPTDDSVKKFAYVAAESSVVRDIRRFLREENGWQAKELNAYGYWKLGTTEEKSAHERRDESHES